LIPDSASNAYALFPPPASSPLPDYPPPTHVAAQPQNAPAAFLHSTQQKRRQSLNEAWKSSSALHHYRQTPWTKTISRFEVLLPKNGILHAKEEHRNWQSIVSFSRNYPAFAKQWYSAFAPTCYPEPTQWVA
ncbi:hypothetical protein GQ607_010811, partial [Colletotrichum asianum]